MNGGSHAKNMAVRGVSAGYRDRGGKRVCLCTWTLSFPSDVPVRVATSA